MKKTEFVLTLVKGKTNLELDVTMSNRGHLYIISVNRKNILEVLDNVLLSIKNSSYDDKIEIYFYSDNHQFKDFDMNISWITKVDLIEQLKKLYETVEDRYMIFYNNGVRNFNELADNQVLPRIFFIINEKPNLGYMSNNEFDDLIQQITQKGKDTGVHIILTSSFEEITPNPVHLFNCNGLFFKNQSVEYSNHLINSNELVELQDNEVVLTNFVLGKLKYNKDV